MKLVLIALLALVPLFSTVSASNSAPYVKHSLYLITPDSASQIDFLKSVSDAHPEQLNVWNELERGLIQPVNIVVEPSFKQEFDQLLRAEGISFDVTIEDLGQTIQQQMSELREAKQDKSQLFKSGGDATGPKRAASLDDFNYGVYHDLAEINTWMDQIGAKYANYVQIVNVSQSFEGRVIRGFKISIPNGGQKKKAIWFDGGIHSREWVSPATVIYMTNELLSKYGVDKDITNLLDSFDFYSVPVVNVDGYVYTWTTERLWRKTRSTNPNTTCIGADPNRNWDAHFCEEGASNNPCTDTFCGQYAFSEIEVRLLAEYLRKNKDDIVCYMNIHAYSQLWMTPYGYTNAKPKLFEYVNEGAKRATEALTKVYGTQYEYGPISQIIYVASGSSADWTYDSLGIVFSYGIELRDNGTFGFVLPADQILPTAIETFEGVKALAAYIKTNPIKNASLPLAATLNPLILAVLLLLALAIGF